MKVGKSASSKLNIASIASAALLIGYIAGSYMNLPGNLCLSPAKSHQGSKQKIMALLQVVKGSKFFYSKYVVLDTLMTGHQLIEYIKNNKLVIDFHPTNWSIGCAYCGKQKIHYDKSNPISSFELMDGSIIRIDFE